MKIGNAYGDISLLDAELTFFFGSFEFAEREALDDSLYNLNIHASRLQNDHLYFIHVLPRGSVETL